MNAVVHRPGEGEHIGGPNLGAALAGKPPSPEEIGRIASRYDFQVA